MSNKIRTPDSLQSTHLSPNFLYWDEAFIPHFPGPVKNNQSILSGIRRNAHLTCALFTF
jgi:hypothetical protein